MAANAQRSAALASSATTIFGSESERWRNDGIWARLNKALVEVDDKSPSSALPSLGVIDSQSRSAGNSEERDGAERI